MIYSCRVVERRRHVYWNVCRIDRRRWRSCAMDEGSFLPVNIQHRHGQMHKPKSPSTAFCLTPCLPSIYPSARFFSSAIKLMRSIPKHIPITLVFVFFFICNQFIWSEFQPQCSFRTVLAVLSGTTSNTLHSGSFSNKLKGEVV